MSAISASAAAHRCRRRSGSRAQGPPWHLEPITALGRLSCEQRGDRHALHLDPCWCNRAPPRYACMTGCAALKPPEEQRERARHGPSLLLAQLSRSCEGRSMELRSPNSRVGLEAAYSI